jgi:type VI secretion system protein ImpK
VTTIIPSDALAAALDAEFVVARARAASRRGDLDEAARLLRDLDATAAPSAAVLDLLARVHAQRGELAEADACWARVQAVDPDDADAAAGRALIAEIDSKRRRTRPVLHPARAVLLAAALAGVIAAGAVIWSGPINAAPPPDQLTAGGPDAAARLQDEIRRADELERRVATLEAERDGSATRLADAVDALARDLAMPGVLLEKRPDAVRVVFEEGLFSRSDEITPAGAAMLSELGRRLAGMDVSTTVVGHAVAVPGGPASGGSVVALARALVAARELADASGVPLTSFTLVSADQAQGPFPDPARNRTVTLLVTPNEPETPR